MSRECRYDSSATWLVTHVQPSHCSGAGPPEYHVVIRDELPTPFERRQQRGPAVRADQRGDGVHLDHGEASARRRDCVPFAGVRLLAHAELSELRFEGVAIDRRWNVGCTHRHLRLSARERRGRRRRAVSHAPDRSTMMSTGCSVSSTGTPPMWASVTARSPVRSSWRSRAAPRRGGGRRQWARRARSTTGTSRPAGSRRASPPTSPDDPAQ
jgi:hypothetical protein